MYLRRDGDTLNFVPEDGPNTRTCAMAGSMREHDPAKPKGYVLRMPREQRANTLLQNYLMDRIETCKDDAERKCVRVFVKLIRSEVSKEGGQNITLAIRKGAKPNSFEIYPNIRGEGRVGRLPMLLTSSTPKLAALFRECSPAVAPVFELPATTSSPRDLDQQRRVIPPKVETMLVPGKRP